MAAFVVSYDLRNPRRDYSRLYTRLNDWGALKVLESVRVIAANSTSEEIRNDLMSYIDNDDGLFVARLTGEAAWQKVLCSNDSLKEKLKT